MSQVGFQKKLQMKTATAIVASDIPATDPSLSLGGDILDDTTVPSAGFRSKVVGIRDWSISATVNYDVASTEIVELRKAWINRTSFTVNYLPNGTKGFTGTAYVESMNFSGDVGGLETISITLQGSGTLSTM